MPWFAEMLEFIDVWVRASKAVLCEGPKRHSQPQHGKVSTQIRTVYVAMLTKPACHAVLVNTLCMYEGNLNLCFWISAWIWWANTRFVSIACNIIILRRSVLRSSQKCQKCQKPHHTLLHSLLDCDRVDKTAGTNKSLPVKTDDSSASHSCSYAGGILMVIVVWLWWITKQWWWFQMVALCPHHSSLNI